MLTPAPLVLWAPHTDMSNPCWAKIFCQRVDRVSTHPSKGRGQRYYQWSPSFHKFFCPEYIFLDQVPGGDQQRIIQTDNLHPLVDLPPLSFDQQEGGPILKQYRSQGLGNDRPLKSQTKLKDIITRILSERSPRSLTSPQACILVYLHQTSASKWA